MPIAPPPARYDAPWKAALSHAFPSFLAFYFPELYQLIDWSHPPRFRDKELAQIGLGDTPSGMVADKLVEVCLRGSSQWVLIHVEVQAQHFAGLAQRVFEYNFRIFREYGQHVSSLVVLGDDDLHWRPHAFHTGVLGTAMGISFSTVKLLDYAGRTGELRASDNPFALVTLAHFHSQRERHDADALATAKLELTRLLYEHRWSRRRIIVLFKVINWMMALPEPHQTRYWHAVLKLEKERKMDLITPLEQSFMDKGWQKGLEKGREEGCRAGAAELLARQLAQRFGQLPKTVEKKLNKATMEQLETWSDAMLTAQSLKQVFG
jgi:hypothetical protein